MDHVKNFEAVVHEAEELTKTWAQMKADLERCRQKIERLRSELTFAFSREEAVQATNGILVLSYTASQYELQLQRFPEKLAGLRQRLLLLPLAQKDIYRVKSHGGVH